MQAVGYWIRRARRAGLSGRENAPIAVLTFLGVTFRAAPSSPSRGIELTAATTVVSASCALTAQPSSMSDTSKPMLVNWSVKLAKSGLCRLASTSGLASGVNTSRMYPFWKDSDVSARTRNSSSCLSGSGGAHTRPVGALHNRDGFRPAYSEMVPLIDLDEETAKVATAGGVHHGDVAADEDPEVIAVWRAGLQPDNGARSRRCCGRPSRRGPWSSPRRYRRRAPVGAQSPPGAGDRHANGTRRATDRSASRFG